MAKRIFTHLNWTPGATADGGTMNAGYMALKGGSGTQKIDILEVQVQGQASAANATPMILAFDSTQGATPTGLATPDADGPMDPATAALTAAPVSFVAATTNPTRSNATTSPKLPVGVNAFGGLIRWNAAPTQQMGILGNVASTGELSLSCYTGGSPGLVQSSILYEPY